ncbi:MAG: site-specific DNA-methyltransferase [Bacteroidales bacterium]|nr:site-specific DNA-methyltransferase [Bacteroidales bacterium]
MLINANALSIPLAAKSVHTIVTSPPYYGLRDYGVDGQLGLEPTPDEYIANLVAVFRECKRILRDDGTLWVNIGDSYASMKSRYNQKAQNLNGGKSQDNVFQGNKTDLYHHPELGIKDKDLIGIPWMLAFALRADGWYLRQDIIWAKPNPMPESVKDRCTKSHEYIFLLSKSAHYYYDNEAIKELATGYDGRKDTKYKGGPKDMAGGAHERWQYKNLQPDGQQPNTMHLNRLVGEEYMSPVRNKRDVWTVTTKPYKGAHYATFNPELIKPCILAGAPEGGIVFDPFVGSGTTVATAIQLGRKGIGIDLSFKYLQENAKARVESAELPLLDFIEQ